MRLDALAEFDPSVAACFPPDRRTALREAAAARIRQSAWPGAEEFARGNVLSVASAEEAFAFFRAHGGP